MNKNDVKDICLNIASQYPGWEYRSHIFKNRQLSHSERWIDPTWVLHLSAEPYVEIYNKSVKKIIREMFNNKDKDDVTARMRILSPDAHNNAMIYRELVHSLSDAENYIHDFFKRGLALIEKYFSHEDEKIFLSSYPIEEKFPTPTTTSGYSGLGNCIAQALILNFDYVEKFITGELPAYYPFHKPNQEKVAEWLPVWRERAEKYGSILKTV